MRAALFYGKEDVRFEEIEPAPVGPDEARVQVAYNGVCGSDLHLYHDPEHSGFVLSHDEAGNVVPIRFGHEYSGTVTEIGSAVTDVAVGDRVAVFPIAYCGTCDICTTGGPVYQCANQGSAFGGVADEVVVGARYLHKLAAGVDMLHGALVEPMAVAWHAINLAKIGPGGTAVVAGAGPIGIGCYLGLKARGIDKVIVSEPNVDRRKVIAALGARTVDPVAEDLAAEVRELSGGRGADAFFDAAGAGPVVEQGVDLLAPYGTFAVVAIHSAPRPVNLWALQIAESSVVGVLCYTPKDFDDVIAAMDTGAYPTDGWVSVRPNTEVVEVIGELVAGQGTKVLLHP